MAQRGEGQGLQIAVISFAMLTIILAITTYVFYAQATTAQKDLQAKNKSLQDKQTENNKLMYRVKAMQLVLGLKGTAKEDVDQAKNQAGGDDAEARERPSRAEARRHGRDVRLPPADGDGGSKEDVSAAGFGGGVPERGVPEPGDAAVPGAWEREGSGGVAVVRSDVQLSEVPEPGVPQSRRHGNGLSDGGLDGPR